MRPQVLGTYPPEPVHATRRAGARDPRRERERSATRLARAGTNGDRDDPAAVIYLAGQAVTVRVAHGALRIGVLTGADENHLFGDTATIPVEFEIDDRHVAPAIQRARNNQHQIRFVDTPLLSERADRLLSTTVDSRFSQIEWE